MASVQVRILQSGRTDAYGLPLIPGSVVTVDRSYAVSLVSTGFASWANPADAYDGETNLRKSDEIYTFAQVYVPFVIFAGDGGANGLSFSGVAGEFTLSAAVVTSFWNLLANGGYAYMPAGAGGLTAGWYWCRMTSDTAGQIFAETYSVTGKPPFVASPTALPNLNPGRIAQGTSEVVAFSFPYVGGSMGPNGSIRLTFSIFGDTSGATKTYRVRTASGSVAIAQVVGSTAPIGDASWAIKNRGTQLAQINSRSGFSSVGSAIGGTFQYTQVDTSIDQTMNVSIQVSSAAATAMLAGFDASVQYGA